MKNKAWPKIAGLACLALLSSPGRAEETAALKQLANLAGPQAAAASDPSWPDDGLSVTDVFVLALNVSAHRDMEKFDTPEKLRDSLLALLARLEDGCVKRAAQEKNPDKKKALLWAHKHLPPVLRRALEIRAKSVVDYVDSLDHAFDAVAATVREAKSPDAAARALDKLFRK